MYYNNLYLHNINEIIKRENYIEFLRFPLKLKENLESSGGVFHDLHGAEIRFIIQGQVELELISLEKETRAVIYYGDFMHELVTIKMSSTKITLDLVYNNYYDKVNSKKYRFNPNLVRIILIDKIGLISISGKYKKPNEDDLPKLKAVAYGTSITQGRVSYYPEINYPQVFANNINADITNYGMSGSCFLEKEVIDFIFKQKYDVIILSPSTNMLGHNYSPEVFRERINYLFKKINELNSESTVLAISLINCYRDLDIIRGSELSTKNRHIFRKILKEETLKHSNVTYVNGKDIISFTNLSSDLVHPGHYGMIEIAYNLTNIYNKRF